MKISGALVLVVLSFAGGLACSPQSPTSTADTAAPSLDLEPCRFEAYDRMLEWMAEQPPSEDRPALDPAAGDAMCGRLEVWEDRQAAAGRRIELNVIVLPATGDDPAPDPLFLFAGGPGTAVSTWGWIVPGLTEVRERRDIVLVDQRGTGKSHPLACQPEGGDDDLQGLIDPMLSPEYVDECRTKLESIADLRHYTTAHAADDIDDVRRALGYEKINLSGGSYGTRPVLVYARRHTEATRTAVIAGVCHTSFHYPLHHAKAGQRAIDLLFEACAADAECAAAYPDPAGDLRALLARFEDGPLPVEIDHPNRDERVTLELHGEVLAERFRSMMYRASDAVRIPRLLREAVSTGDLEELTEEVLRYQAGFGEGEDWWSGMWLSVTCSEDLHLIDDQQVIDATAGTFLGDYRVRTHRAACERWPRGDLPEGYHDHVSVDVPFLIRSGELDPVTPSWAGDESAAHLPNSLHVVAREGHSATDPDCARSVVLAFIEAGTTEGLDVSCLEAVDLPPWDLG